MKRKLIVMCAVLSLMLAANTVFAGEAKVTGKVEFVPFKVEGLIVGKKLVVDAAFGKKYNNPVNAPFECIVPREKGVKTFAAFPPDTGGSWIKLSFATEDKQLIENLQYTAATVPLENNAGATLNMDQRLAVLENLLTKQGLPMGLKDYPKNKFLGARRTKIKDTPGVEVAAVFEDKDLGLMFMWMIGLLQPDSKHGVMAVSRMVASRSEVKKPEDIGRKGLAAKAVSTFKFISD